MRCAARPHDGPQPRWHDLPKLGTNQARVRKIGTTVDDRDTNFRIAQRLFAAFNKSWYDGQEFFGHVYASTEFRSSVRDKIDTGVFALRL